MEKEIKTLIDALSERIVNVLGDNFMSLYIHGSLALGDFNENSDIDFVVITNHMIEDINVIEKVHRELENYPWGSKLEGSYITKNMASCDKLLNDKRLYFNSSVLKWEPYGYEWYFERTILINHGLLICGEDFYSKLLPPTHEVLKEACVSLVVDTWIPLMDRGNLTDEYIVFGVLSMGRLMYTLETGEITTKLKASQWTIDKGYDKNIILDALSSGHVENRHGATEFIRQMMDEIISEVYVNPYNLESYIPEIYDDLVAGDEDVSLILELAKKHSIKHVLEPFSGTGRLMIPLLKAGYHVTGIDGSEAMVKRYLDKLDDELKGQSKVMVSNALECDWGFGYDLIILGGNCFFELGTLKEQSKIIDKAYDALNEGGYLFIDNDNIEGQLPESWCHIGKVSNGFPTGECRDGTQLDAFVKPIYVHKKNKIWIAERTLNVIGDGKIIRDYKWIQQKHPIGYSEITEMLKNKFTIINVWNGVKKKAFDSNTSNRCTIWARKGEMHAEIIN